MWKGIQPFSSSASYIPTLDKQITHHLHYIQVEATQIEQTQVEDRTAKLLWLFSTYGTSWKLLMRFHFSPWTSSCTWEEIEKISRTFCKEWAAFLNFRGMQHQNIWIFGKWTQIMFKTDPIKSSSGWLLDFMPIFFTTQWHNGWQVQL